MRYPMKKENQKIIFSKELIRNAALILVKEKSKNKITISELCKTAGVSRDTFYKYYQCIDDVFSEIYSKAKEGILLKMEPLFKSKNLKKDLITYLNYVRENNLFFQYIFIDKNIIPEEIKEIKKEIMTSISSLFHEDDETENEMNAYFLYSGSLAIIENWVKNQDRYSTGEIAELLTKIANKMLR